MKKTFTKFLAIGGAALLMLASCKKDEQKAVAQNGAGAVLAATSTTLKLDKTNLSGNAVTFSYSPAAFGYRAAITNTLQIDVPGDNFAKPKEVTLGANVFQQSYTQLDFNNLALALNLPALQASQVQVRLKSTISANVAPVYSNVLSLNVTPFAIVSYVYVPGAYQGWNPATADSLQSPTGNGVYQGVITFTGSDLGYKITTARNWNNAYGDAGAGKVSLSGGNLTAPGDGAYQITLDENANTIAYKPMQWSIIGNGAIDWSTDVDMKYNNGTMKWVATVTLHASGQIKFRLNHDWGTNYGATGSALVSGGDNINIPADGTYVVTLDFVNNTYSLVKQ